MSPIFVVGIGGAGASDLSPAAQQIIKEASLLVGGRRHLSYFPVHSAPKLTLGDLGTALQQVQQQVAAHPTETVVILASGDPLFFGLGRLLLRTFAADQLTFLPHLSAVQIAFSRIKVPWQDANIISLHGRSPDDLIKALQKGESKIALFTDPTYTPAAIAHLFLSLKLPVSYTFWVCEDLEGPTERVQAFEPEALIDTVFAPLNVVILLRCERLPQAQDWPCLGIGDQYFISFPDRPNLITKREIRVLAISELELHPHQVIWDIGAGTGSVSVEMARLSPSSTVYATEKTAIGHHLIEQNCQRFNVNNVKAIHGEAPQSLDSLPAPDRIFIGGSGGNLPAILEYCQGYYQNNIVIVIALATLENLEVARHWLTQHHWSIQLAQVQLSRSVAIANLTRWQPLNPVVLLKAQPQVINR